MWQGIVRTLALVLGLVIASAGAAAQVGPGDGAPAEPENHWTEVPHILARFDGLPPAPAFVGIARLTFPPGASASGGGLAGPRLILVESGAIVVEVQEAATVVRPQQSVPPMIEPVAADSAVTLRSGDYLLVPEAPPIEIRNEESRPTSFLDTAIFPHAPNQLRPFTTASGVIFEPLAVGMVEALPTTPVEIVLSEISIPPGQALPLEPLPGPQLLYIQSGRLGIDATAGVVEYRTAASNNPGSVQGGPRRIVIGSRVLITAGSSIVRQVGSDGRAENVGRSTVVLLTLTISSPATDA